MIQSLVRKELPYLLFEIMVLGSKAGSIQVDDLSIDLMEFL